jgi:hypothetical protein
VQHDFRERACSMARCLESRHRVRCCFYLRDLRENDRERCVLLWIIRLQEIDGPGLCGINSDKEDGVLAVELAGDDDSRKEISAACRIARITGANPRSRVGIQAVIVFGPEIDDEVAVAEAIGRGGRIILPVLLRKVSTVE